MALAQVGGARRVIIVLEDRLLRESLAMALAEDGLRVLEFASSDAALSHIEAGADVDALIVDAPVDAPVDGRAAGAGERPRARLRAARCASPVYVLSSHGNPRGNPRGNPQGGAQGAADEWGAVGIIDRTQPFASLLRNLRNAIRAGALLGEPGVLATARSQGPLVFSAADSRVTWKDSYLDLSPAEQALLGALVAAPEPGLTYRRAQTILTSLDDRQTGGQAGGVSGDSPGDGPERVKSLVRRLRKKFREVDPDFDRIVFVPGCGYGWRGSERPRSEVPI